MTVSEQTENDFKCQFLLKMFWEYKVKWHEENLVWQVRFIDWSTSQICKGLEIFLKLFFEYYFNPVSKFISGICSNRTDLKDKTMQLSLLHVN